MRARTDIEAFDLHQLHLVPHGCILCLIEHHAVFVHHVENSAPGQETAGFPFPYGDCHRARHLLFQVAELQPVEVIISLCGGFRGRGGDQVPFRLGLAQAQNAVAFPDAAEADHVSAGNRAVSDDADLPDPEDPEIHHQHSGDQQPGQDQYRPQRNNPLAPFFTWQPSGVAAGGLVQIPAGKLVSGLLHVIPEFAGMIADVSGALLEQFRRIVRFFERIAVGRNRTEPGVSLPVLQAVVRRTGHACGIPRPSARGLLSGALHPVHLHFFARLWSVFIVLIPDCSQFP